MKKALIIVVIFIVFLILSIYSVWRADAKGSGLPDNAFQNQVYHGGFQSSISTYNGRRKGATISLGQYNTKEHVEYLEKENNLSNYISSEKDRMKFGRLSEVMDIILTPDLRSNLEDKRNAEYFLKDIIENQEEEIDHEGGVVKLKRNGSDEYLTYLPMDEYEALKTAENLEQLKKHFTLDEEGKIVVIGWKEIVKQTTKYKDEVAEAEPITETRYEYKDIKYNYKQVLEPYEVDSNFLNALLIYSSPNTEFVFDFAKYVIENTDVVFMIYDNENTTVEEKITTYDEEITFKGSLAVEYNEANIGSGTLDAVVFTEPYPTKKINYKEEIKITTTEVNAFIDIQKAELWCSSFTYEYTAGEPISKEEPEQNTQQPDSQISNGEPKTIDSSYEFYSDIQGEISKIEAIQEEKLKAILKDVLIANDIKQYLEDNIGEIVNETEDVQNDYKLLAELSSEFVEMVKTKNIDIGIIMQKCVEKKQEEEKNLGGDESIIIAQTIALREIKKNLESFANEFQELNYDNANFENLTKNNVINITEDRKQINTNIKTKVTTTEIKYNKVNYTFSEKTDTNQETGDNFIKIYKNHNVKMEYNWIEEVINDYDVPQSSKDIFLYMLKIAITGKGSAENKLESTIVTNDIIISNNSSTQTGEEFWSAPGLNIDRDTAIEIINNLNNEKAKQELNGKIDIVMEAQENDGISALFVIAAIDVESDGATEEVNVEDFLNEVKTIKSNGAKTIDDIAEDYAKRDKVWINTVKQKALEKYREVKGFNPGEVQEAGDGYPNKYVSNLGYTYYNYKQLGEAAKSYADKCYLKRPDGEERYIGKVGCMLTACTICVSGKTGEDINPFEAVEDMNGEGNIFTKEHILGEHLAFYGLRTEWASPSDKAGLIKHLKTGNPVIVYVKAPSKYTSQQHYMAILDVDYSNENLVYLSNPSNYSDKTGWQDLDGILEYCQDIWLVYFN